LTERREYIEGVPQATEREREWARGAAKLIVDMTRLHQGGIKGDADELEGQIARELRAAVALLNGGI
jgi:hypothetical protein